jgi:pSer/pThr/pTyr-binding forkhead associated (FHA) protein
MKLNLVVRTGGRHGGEVIPIGQLPFLIGRDPECHLRPASALIARRHCAITVRDDKVFLEDFQTTNGTYVNGRQVRGAIELLDGDELKIGPLAFGLQVVASAGDISGGPQAGEKEADDEAAAALLLSLQEQGGQGNPALDKAADHTTLREVKTKLLPTKQTPPPEPRGATPPDMPFGTSSSARELLKMYRKRPQA